jgi:GAF domain-containing protein
MQQKIIRTLTVCALLLAGCHTPTSERMRMRCEPDGRTVVRKAPCDGDYRLYVTSLKRPTLSTASPVVETRLREGDLVGLARDSAGRWVAVIGQEQRPLTLDDAARDAHSALCWTVQAEPGQIDSARTAWLVVSVLVIVGVAVAIVAAAASEPDITLPPVNW